VCGPKREEIRGPCRNLLHDLYSSPNIIWVIKWKRKIWARHVARIGKKRNAYWGLVGKHTRKSLLSKPRCRNDDVIKIVLRETGWSVDRILLAQDYELP